MKKKALPKTYFIYSLLPVTTSLFHLHVVSLAFINATIILLLLRQLQPAWLSSWHDTDGCVCIWSDFEIVWDAGTVAIQDICSKEEKNYIYKVKHTMEEYNPKFMNVFTLSFRLVKSVVFMFSLLKCISGQSSAILCTAKKHQRKPQIQG